MSADGALALGQVDKHCAIPGHSFLVLRRHDCHGNARAVCNYCFSCVGALPRSVRRFAPIAPDLFGFLARGAT